MLIEVRGGASRRFSAPQRPICCSPSLLSTAVPQGRQRRLPAPAAQQAVRTGRCADLVVDLFPLMAGRPVVYGAQGWRGVGKVARPLLIIAFSGSILGDARYRLCAAAARNGLSVRPAVCRSK